MTFWIVVLILWNTLLTWYVFKHVGVYNRTVATICKAVPGLQVVDRNRRW